MELKKIGLFLMACMIAGVFTTELMVKADNDDDDWHYEKHEDEKYWDDDKYEDEKYWDDDKYEYKDHHEYDEDEEYDHDDYNNLNIVTSPQETWSIWTRTSVVSKGELPFQEPKLVTLKTENGEDELSFYAIPRDGEIFVPGKAVAGILGAKATFYETSRILDVTTGDLEIILRANTNVAYENDLKTPIPSTAFYMNNDVYVPISVITNALGYVVDWQGESNMFVCKSLLLDEKGAL